MPTLEQARIDYRANSVRWGFTWALSCAVLWGLWYLPSSAIWTQTPFSTLASGPSSQLLLAAVIITTFNALAVVLFLILWMASLQKLGEYGRTLRQMKKLSIWYFLAAIFGGPCAIFGSYVAIAYVGPVFAAIAGLLYPIIGATLARLWYNEKITKRAAIGIFIIVAGGVAIFAPGLWSEFHGNGTGNWLGYVGGAMAAVGWGVEGAIAGRALDVSDPDVGLPIRFTAEALYWVCIAVPLAIIFGGWQVVEIIQQTFHFWTIVWLLMAGLTFGFCYVSWYKSFPLIGVGRGQAIGALYGLFSVVFLAVFAFQFPQWYFLIGLALTILGGFVMYTESDDVMEVIRDVGHTG